MPIVGHLAENGLIIGEEFRQGNDAPGARNLEFIKYCAGQMPAGRRMAALRADSAAYQADIINWCEKDDKARVLFAIGADLDAGVKSVIRALSPGGMEAIQGWSYCRDSAQHEQDKEGVSVDRDSSSCADGFTDR